MDKLEALRAATRILRDKEREIADLEERLEHLRKEVSALRHRSLPEMFYQAGVDHIGLPQEGNFPAVDAKLKKDYKASIPASWPAAKRDEAFRTLDDLALQNLMKITYTVPFEAGQRDRAEKFGDWMRNHSISFSVARSVHHASLSSALKEICEQGNVPSSDQLAAIGGFIGDSVTIKRRDQ